ncbi:trypsin-like peptidase domain-containing protein [Micromonospora sp. NPDC049559]|uniref:trypsin-like peptidase domain-containing protein n=1 Tax=Micromonospora sp. NPDC049559 TaxID=3155923 RepID=UPI003425423E
MNEYETDPQRPPATPDAEPSHPTAELPRDRGQSDSATPASEPGTTGSAWAAPSHQPPAAGTGEPSTAPLPPAGGPAPFGSPAPGAPGAPAAPGGGEAPTAPVTPISSPTGSPYPAGPVPSAPGAGRLPDGTHQVGYQPNPWHPGYQHSAQHNQPGWAANPSYPGQHGPGVNVPPPGQHPAGPPLPPWAQGPAGPRPNAVAGRLAKVAAVGAAALVLMVGSGIAGGVAALAIRHDGPAGVTRTYSAAPVLNSADLPKIAAQVENSVVSITTGSAEGSGVVLSADGYVLSNNHVVASAQGNTVKVVFADGKTASAKIIGTDPKTDLAVIKADGVSGLTPAKFGDSDAMQVGDTVLALGSPLGLQGSVTAGIISARDRTIQTGGEDEQEPTNPFQRPQQQAPVSSISGLLQTDAPINPGNSGGALINTRSEVIGINTAIATAGQSNGNIGVGFAIPSNKAKAVADLLRQGKKVSHPSLGVGVGDNESGGAVISSVTPGSPAEKAGLQQGDVVTRFGDKIINGSNDLVAAVQSGKVGDQVQLTFTRNGAEKTATVTLAETS